VVRKAQEQKVSDDATEAEAEKERRQRWQQWDVLHDNKPGGDVLHDNEPGENSVEHRFGIP
jgi:hypothetical protein